MARTTIRTEDVTDSEVTTAKMAVDPTNATNLASGTVADARLGTIPADITANQTGITANQDDIALLGFKVAANGSLARYNLVDQSIDAFEDASGVDASASTDETRNSANYYSGKAIPTVSGNYDDSGVDGDHTWYKWTTVTGSGTYTTNEAQDYKYYVIGGGGGGGGQNGGGGGGGGYRYNTTYDFPVSAATHTIVVGGGGTAGPSPGPTTGGNGSDSSFSTITSTGGGGAGSYSGSIGNDGGSGGGGGGDGTISGPGTGGSGNTPSTSPAQGKDGGQGGSSGAGAGGGGFTVAGGDSVVNGGGGGGNGGDAGSDIDGGPVTNRGAGGGGAGFTTGGAGGAGGGGAGGGGNPSQGVAGTANTGGGGGGSVNNIGGVGGSGIVIIRRPTTGTATDMTLISNAQTAESAPTTGDLVITYTNGAGTATINTDLKAYISRDGSAYTSAVTLVDKGDTGGHTILTANGVDLSGITSGTSMRWKIETLNQGASKETRIQAVSLGWS